MARGEVAPGDIDIFIDYDASQYDSETKAESRRHLIWLSKRCHGAVDPFFLSTDARRAPGPVLFCRNDHSTGWMVASRAKAILKNIRAEGRPLSELSVTMDRTPVDYRPEDWAVEDFHARLARWENYEIPEARSKLLSDEIERAEKHAVAAVQEAAASKQKETCGMSC